MLTNEQVREIQINKAKKSKHTLRIRNLQGKKENSIKKSRLLINFKLYEK